MLGRSHLIVLGLGRERPASRALYVHIIHVGADPLPDGSEVVILHLLAPWAASRRRASGPYRSGPCAASISGGPPGNTPAPVPRRGRRAWPLCFQKAGESGEACSLIRPAWNAAGGSFCPGPHPCRSRRRWECRASRRWRPPCRNAGEVQSHTV